MLGIIELWLNIAVTYHCKITTTVTVKEGLLNTETYMHHITWWGTTNCLQLSREINYTMHEKEIMTKFDASPIKRCHICNEQTGGAFQ